MKNEYVCASGRFKLKYKNQKNSKVFGVLLAQDDLHARLTKKEEKKNTHRSPYPLQCIPPPSHLSFSSSEMNLDPIQAATGKM